MTRLMASVVILAMLSGCWNLSFSGHEPLDGDHVGPGHCRHADVLDVRIVGFKGPQNATIAFRLENIRNKTHADPRVGGFRGFSLTGDDGKVADADWGFYLSNHSRAPNIYAAGENRTEAWNLSTIPKVPWREFSLAYVYTVDSGQARDRPTSLRCSLVGDNAPWAFENATMFNRSVP